MILERIDRLELEDRGLIDVADNPDELEIATVGLIARPYVKSTEEDRRQAIVANTLLPPKVIEPIRLSYIGSSVVAQL